MPTAHAPVVFATMHVERPAAGVSKDSGRAEVAPCICVRRRAVMHVTGCARVQAAASFSATVLVAELLAAQRVVGQTRTACGVPSVQ